MKIADVIKLAYGLTRVNNLFHRIFVYVIFLDISIFTAKKHPIFFVDASLMNRLTWQTERYNKIHNPMIAMYAGLVLC